MKSNPVMPKKRTEHYVNNKELLEALIVYRSYVQQGKRRCYIEKYE